MSETIPIIVGVFLSALLVRWIYNNRNPDLPRGPPQEAVRQLQNMFPNIPEAVIRSELVRGGSIQAAIERLLLVSERYPAVRQQMAFQSNEVPQKNTLRSVLDNPIEDLEPMKIDATTWNKDQAVRENLLVHRKQEMVQKARRERGRVETIKIKCLFIDKSLSGRDIVKRLAENKALGSVRDKRVILKQLAVVADRRSYSQGLFVLHF